MNSYPGQPLGGYLPYRQPLPRNVNVNPPVPDDDLTSNPPPLSIGGLERAPSTARDPFDDESSISDDMSLASTVPKRAEGVLKAKNDVLDLIHNKTISAEDTDLMIKRLEKTADRGFRRTYIAGQPIKHLRPEAPVLKVGLSFLPGADKPQVARLEQTNMIVNRQPDQRDALWRVNTAGTLLSHFDVTQELSIDMKDQTGKILEKARKRIQRNRSSLALPPPSASSVTLMGQEYDAVTIDSNEVLIVSDLRDYQGQFDVESTLVEVDGPSLMDLIVRWRHLVRHGHGGPTPPPEKTKELLETMIEDARRLCHRSPILFRMSTRNRIITSKNTRYGVNHGRQFQTLTTSKGIQEIISVSAAYYNSLDEEGKGSLAQKVLRPRFFQVMVLLLSLLNDDDLTEIRGFLESTYRFKADRPNLELLFLKVIPLSSINPEVFLSSMIPAFEGYKLKSPGEEDCAHFWDTFLKRILGIGYLLPGTIENLGRDPMSWIVKWPEDGIKSSVVFRNLQYSGTLQAFNEIPPIEDLYPEDDTNELTVIMMNEARYTIRSCDYEKIVCLTPGTYDVLEARVGGRHFDLEVREQHLNVDTEQACRSINNIIQNVNGMIGAPRRSQSKLEKFSRGLAPRRRHDISMLKDCRISGRITKHTAVLNQDILAVAYKLEGRKISKRDTVSILASDNAEIKEVVRYYEGRMADDSYGLDPRQTQPYRAVLSDISRRVHTAENFRFQISKEHPFPDEPIAAVIQPGTGNPLAQTVWNKYKCQISGDGLQMEAKQSTVSGVQWHTDEKLVEISLNGSDAKYLASPLRVVDEAQRDDEVRVGDTVMLAGRYIIIAERPEEGAQRDFILTNYLRIENVTEPVQSQRGANRAVGGGRGANRNTDQGDKFVQCLFV